MPGFQKDAFRTPFGRNVFLRSTQDVKTTSYTVAKSTVTARTIDGATGQKVLQPGTVLAKITSGPDEGKVGPYQAVGTNEVQRITITGSPTGGTFTLTYAGQTTAAIAHNATAAAVKSALEALSNIAVGTIQTSGGALPGTAVDVTFLFGGNVAEMTATGSLTGGSTPAVAVTTVTPGVAGAQDGRGVSTNIVGICNTFLPWQLIERDVEVAVIYEASVVQNKCLEYDTAGAEVALTDTTAGHLVGKKSLDIKFH